MMSTHACHVIMKMTMLLCDYLADDICYELSNFIMKKNMLETYEKENLDIMDNSISTLAGVVLISRKNSNPTNLNGLIMIYILKTYFNLGTEKVKKNFSWKQLCCL